jgi:hypothetical protein
MLADLIIQCHSAAASSHITDSCVFVTMNPKRQKTAKMFNTELHVHKMRPDKLGCNEVIEL